MCGILVVGSELETWRDGGSVSFERISDVGGMFSALAMASRELLMLVVGREA